MEEPTPKAQNPQQESKKIQQIKSKLAEKQKPQSLIQKEKKKEAKHEEMMQDDDEDNRIKEEPTKKQTHERMSQTKSSQIKKAKV